MLRLLTCNRVRDLGAGSSEEHPAKKKPAEPTGKLHPAEKKKLAEPARKKLHPAEKKTHPAGKKKLAEAAGKKKPAEAAGKKPQPVGKKKPADAAGKEPHPTGKKVEEWLARQSAVPFGRSLPLDLSSVGREKEKPLSLASITIASTRECPREEENGLHSSPHGSYMRGRKGQPRDQGCRLQGRPLLQGQRLRKVNNKWIPSSWTWDRPYSSDMRGRRGQPRGQGCRLQGRPLLQGQRLRKVAPLAREVLARCHPRAVALVAGAAAHADGLRAELSPT
ncbi:hypothetical protein GW17_00030425 [Ensete ventricosum]|nr:hypothetical protein GW17_00030425 [Ensete ventricosum]